MAEQQWKMLGHQGKWRDFNEFLNSFWAIHIKVQLWTRGPEQEVQQKLYASLMGFTLVAHRSEIAHFNHSRRDEFVLMHPNENMKLALLKMSLTNNSALQWLFKWQNFSGNRVTGFSEQHQRNPGPSNTRKSANQLIHSVSVLLVICLFGLWMKTYQLICHQYQYQYINVLTLYIFFLILVNSIRWRDAKNILGWSSARDLDFVWAPWRENLAGEWHLVA